MKDDTISAIKRALRADLEVEDVEFLGGDEHDGFMFEGSGASNRETEWVIFTDDDMARQAAINRVKDDLEYEPEIFNRSFLEQHLYISDTDRAVLADDEADSVVMDLTIDEVWNRLEDSDGLEDEYNELEQRSMDDESPNEDRMDEIFWEAKEMLKEQISEEIYESLEDPIDYFVNELGAYSVGDLFTLSFIRIDVEQAAMEAVNTDGVAHFLDQYDGEEEEITDPETNETFFAYGSN